MPPRPTPLARLVTALAAAALAACGPAPEPSTSPDAADADVSKADAADAVDPADAAPPPDPFPAEATAVSADIGPEGGVLALPGARLIVPHGALSEIVTITLTRTPDDPPAAFTAGASLTRFEPGGLTFAVPAVVTLWFEPGHPSPGIYWEAPGGGYDWLGGAVLGDSVTASVVHFSDAFVATAPAAPQPDVVAPPDADVAPPGDVGPDPGPDTAPGPDGGCPDGDGDGVCDADDLCPAHADPEQLDADGDGLGDACDPCPADPANDEDGDGVCGDVDLCPHVGDPGQEDGDGDGVGDACDFGFAGAIWPQSADRRFMPSLTTQLAERYDLVRGGGTPYPGELSPLSCGKTCGGTCGLFHDGPLDALLVSTGDAGTWLAWPEGTSTRLARVLTDGPLQAQAPVDVPDARFIDLLQVATDAGSSYLVGLDASNGASWLVGLSPLSGQVRWRVVRPALSPASPPSAVVVTDDARFLVLTANGRLYESPIPADGQVREATPVALPSEGAAHRAVDVAVDDLGRIYVAGDDLIVPPLCTPALNESEMHRVPRLRVFGPGWQMLAQVDTQVGPMRVERALEAGAPDRYRVVMLTDEPPDIVGCDRDTQNWFKSPYEFSDDLNDLAKCPSVFQEACEAAYPADAPSCCKAGGQGCASDPELEACVCGKDAYCCDTEWDGVCVDIAETCGLTCGGGGGDAGYCPCRGCSGGGMIQICPPPLCLAGMECPGPYPLMVVHTLSSSGPTTLTHVGARVMDVQAKPADLALDGHGHALVRYGRVIDLAAPPGTDPVVADLGTQQLGAALVDATSGPAPRYVTGWSPFTKVIDTYGYVRAGLQTGRLGPTPQVASHTSDLGGRSYDWASGGERPVWARRLVPLGDGALLAVGHALNGAVAGTGLRLFVPADAYVHDKDMTTAPADGPIPELAPCPDPDLCPRFDLGLEVPEALVLPADDPDAHLWVTCQTRKRKKVIGGYAIESFPCPDDGLRADWAKAAKGSHRLTNATELACTSATTKLTLKVDSPQGDTWTETKSLRCTAWRELFKPGNPARRATTLLGVWPRLNDAPACDAYGRAAPLRAVAVAGPQLVVSATVDGAPAGEVAPGDTVTLAASPQGASTTFRVVGGAASLAGDSDGDGQVDTTSGTVQVQLDGEGIVTIEVVVRDADGVVVGVRRVSFAVLPKQACAEDEAGFHLCNARLGLRIPEEDEQPSRATPAEAAVGVQLHDRSLLLDEVDLVVDGGDLGPPVILSRTWNGANVPTGGGWLGGWVFGFDQRLGPATDDLSWTLLETDDAPVDLALADGAGRVDVFRHPGASTEVTFTAAGGPGPHYWVYDHAEQTLKAREFTARVVTYDSPRGLFATLRSYTLQVPPGQVARDVHPFAPRPDEASAETELGPNEQRFYELTDPADHRRIFDCKGHLVRVVDPRFHEVELVWRDTVDPITRTRRLTAIIDAAGRATQVHWTPTPAGDRIARLVDPFGREVHYTYGHGGQRLTTVTVLASGPGAVTQTRHYRYDAEGRLEAVADADTTLDAPTMVVEYDAQGRVARQRLGRDADGPAAQGAYADGRDGATWELADTAQGVEVLGPDGVLRAYVLTALPDGGPRVVESVTVTRPVADAATLAGTTSPGRVDTPLTTSYAHTPAGLVAAIETPSGRRTELDWSPQGHLVERRVFPVGGGAPETATFDYAEVNAPSHASFQCFALVAEVAPGGAQTTQSYWPFDPTQPGRACLPATRTLPPTQAVDGGVVAWGEQYDHVPAGRLRGLVAERRVQYGTTVASRVTRLWQTPQVAPGDPLSARSGKLPVAHLGHPAGVTTSGELPVVDASLCAGAVPASVTTQMSTDARGNLTEIREQRLVACASSADCDGGACTDGSCVVTVETVQTFDARDRLVRVVTDPDRFPQQVDLTYDGRDGSCPRASTPTTPSTTTPRAWTAWAAPTAAPPSPTPSTTAWAAWRRSSSAATPRTCSR